VSYFLFGGTELEILGAYKFDSKLNFIFFFGAISGSESYYSGERFWDLRMDACAKPVGLYYNLPALSLLQ